MKIYPECAIVPLSECKPGQIVRNIAYGNDGKFALASDIADSDRRALVIFGVDGPGYEVFEHDNNCKVLAFRGTPIWEIDQFGPFEPPIRDLYSRNGCLIRSQDSWIMNVQHGFDSFRHHRGHYDLKLGSLIQLKHDLNHMAVFGSWRLSLHDEDRPLEERIEIASFIWTEGSKATS